MTTTSLSRILIVTPTLGDSPFLDETVASVTAQAADVHHVIAVPASKVTAMQARFPHGQVCHDSGRTGGIYGALNAALEQAAGDWEWFTYINDDDTLLPGFSVMLERELQARDSADVVYGDVELIDENGQRISRITTERSPAWIPALLQQGISPLMQQGMLFRRAIVDRMGGFDTRFRLCADLDFWLRAFADGAKFRSHHLRVAQFRLRRGQLSSNTSMTAREQSEIVVRHLPGHVPKILQALAWLRYRCHNLPRYLARIRSRGFQASYELLGTGEVRR